MQTPTPEETRRRASRDHRIRTADAAAAPSRFREKDYGNAGHLNVQQMREVLQELREEERTRTQRAAEGKRMVHAAIEKAKQHEAQEKRRMSQIGLEPP